MEETVVGQLIREIKMKRTKVFEKDGVKVYAVRKINGSSLKEELELRVIANGTLSRMYETSVIGIDPEKQYKELLGCAGLDFRDIKIMASTINKMYTEIKMIDANESGVVDILGEMYSLLEDRVCSGEEVKINDVNLEKSILVQDKYYVLKAGTLRRIADELEIKYTNLRKELVSLGFIEKGIGRDSISISVNNRKMKLIKINRDKLIRLFDTVEVKKEAVCV